MEINLEMLSKLDFGSIKGKWLKEIIIHDLEQWPSSDFTQIDNITMTHHLEQWEAYKKEMEEIREVIIQEFETWEETKSFKNDCITKYATKKQISQLRNWHQYTKK